MIKHKEFISVIVVCSALVILTSCKKDAGSTENKIQSLTGYAQKGPLINGSSVTVFDLQSDLSQTGKSYNSQISDNKGTFQLDNISLSSDYISLRADGFYFNEISGDQSDAQITLYALADVTGRDEININLLTHLEKSRVEYLMKAGKSFAESKAQAQKEILGIFNIEKSVIKASENLNLSQEGDDNGILLAVSSILQGYRSESELTELLSNISNDIKEDGTMDSEDLGSLLINHAINLDTVSIKANLADRYSDIGATYSIPFFGKYISNFISKTNFVVTESPLSYPETGIFGDNILSLAKTTFSSGFDFTYSLAAQLASGTSLKIRISSIFTYDDTGAVTKPMWYRFSGSENNWSVSDFEFDSYAQTFTAIESGKSCDLKMFFDPGSFLIEYFEMNATLPTRTKTIICN
jgi:hypothetical protein